MNSYSALLQAIAKK